MAGHAFPVSRSTARLRQPPHVPTRRPLDSRWIGDAKGPLQSILLLKSQSAEGPDKYREPRRFEMIPSSPIRPTCRSIGPPQRSNDSLNRIAAVGLRNRQVSARLRSSMRSLRRSKPFTSSKSNAYNDAPVSNRPSGKGPSRGFPCSSHLTKSPSIMQDLTGSRFKDSKTNGNQGVQSSPRSV